MTDNVLQDVFQAGIQDASIRNHLALQAGRLNSLPLSCQWTSLCSRVKERARTARAKTVRAWTVSGKTKGKGSKDKAEYKSSSHDACTEQFNWCDESAGIDERLTSRMMNFTVQ